MCLSIYLYTLPSNIVYNVYVCLSIKTGKKRGWMCPWVDFSWGEEERKKLLVMILLLAWSFLIVQIPPWFTKTVICLSLSIFLLEIFKTVFLSFGNWLWFHFNLGNHWTDTQASYSSLRIKSAKQRDIIQWSQYSDTQGGDPTSSLSLSSSSSYCL